MSSKCHQHVIHMFFTAYTTMVLKLCSYGSRGSLGKFKGTCKNWSRAPHLGWPTLSAHNLHFSQRMLTASEIIKRQLQIPVLTKHILMPASITNLSHHLVLCHYNGFRSLDTHCYLNRHLICSHILHITSLLPS